MVNEADIVPQVSLWAGILNEPWLLFEVEVKPLQ